MCSCLSVDLFVFSSCVLNVNAYLPVGVECCLVRMANVWCRISDPISNFIQQLQTVSHALEPFVEVARLAIKNMNMRAQVCGCATFNALCHSWERTRCNAMGPASDSCCHGSAYPALNSVLWRANHLLSACVMWLFINACLMRMCPSCVSLQPRCPGPVLHPGPDGG